MKCPPDGRQINVGVQQSSRAPAAAMTYFQTRSPAENRAPLTLFGDSPRIARRMNVPQPAGMAHMRQISKVATNGIAL